MRRILSFLNPADGAELILPVTPPSYTWTHGNRVETIQLDQLGEINLPGGRVMGSCTLSDVLFPANLYSFCNPGTVANPYVYLERLARWSDAHTVVRFIVSGTPTNASVLIESIDYGERDGTNDIYATIVLRQYQVPETPVLSIAGGGAQTDRSTATGAAQTRSYTVQRGDTLWGIARKFYGDGSLAYRLAAANSTIIRNPNLIYPGQVLTIPPADKLSGPMETPQSVKTANATKTVYDPVDKRWALQLQKETQAMR